MTLAPSSPVLLCTVLLCHIKDLPCGNAAHIEIIISQLVENVEQFIQGVQEKSQSVASPQDVYHCASLSFKCLCPEICKILFHMAPNWFIAASEADVKTPMEDHIKSES